MRRQPIGPTAWRSCAVSPSIKRSWSPQPRFPPCDSWDRHTAVSRLTSTRKRRFVGCWPRQLRWVCPEDSLAGHGKRSWVCWLVPDCESRKHYGCTGTTWIALKDSFGSGRRSSLPVESFRFIQPPLQHFSATLVSAMVVSPLHSLRRSSCRRVVRRFATVRFCQRSNVCAVKHPCQTRLARVLLVSTICVTLLPAKTCCAGIGKVQT